MAMRSSGFSIEEITKHEKIIFALVIIFFFLQLSAQVKDSIYYKKIADPATSFIQLKEGYKIFSQKFGTGKIKILFLHGGPGNTHEYFEIFKDQLSPDQFQLFFMTNWVLITQTSLMIQLYLIFKDL
jgi:hypothetical protein